MNKNKIIKIKNYIKEECQKQGNVGIDFYNVHLLAVEKFALILLKKLPKADSEVVMLGVWLHDMQRIRKIKGDHQKIGASEAEKVLCDFKVQKEVIVKVKEIILSHSCERKMPGSLEAKILSSADAMAHYSNDFYLWIACTGQRSAKDFKKFVIAKTEKDFNKKIYFDFAKKMVKKQHEAWKIICLKI